MKFATALSLILSGSRLTRPSFNGNFVFMMQGICYKAPEHIGAVYFDNGPEGISTRLPQLMLQTPEHMTVYMPSQEDLFAHDWIEAE